jgi:hypothetical protein
MTTDPPEDHDPDQASPDSAEAKGQEETPEDDMSWLTFASPENPLSDMGLKITMGRHASPDPPSPNAEQKPDPLSSAQERIAAMSEDERDALRESGRSDRLGKREPSAGRGNAEQKLDPLSSAQERIAAMSPDEQRALLESELLARLAKQKPSRGRLD